MENLWCKREKADELKELKKKERNDERLAVESRRIEMKQEQEELELKRRMDDEKIMNMDLSAMSELQKKFYIGLQEEIIARRYSSGT
ncbi:hypothetical protein HU200_059451 [Digitaria exilis]|uniref:No apical meristem-associated C-terminal domain-containing protein n=1 Tax=Digitaria exilis TaxID=1010633 RepID=A0A835A6V0_9POAL|nr:hypothetical protein HU200_063634 [Digitaria exilis]KAF8657991.1 hypothetical protein HU200_059451 [Digitaria exilis]